MVQFYGCHKRKPQKSRVHLTLGAVVPVESRAGALAAEAAVAHLDAHAAVLARARRARVVRQCLARCKGQDFIIFIYHQSSDHIGKSNQ